MPIRSRFAALLAVLALLTAAPCAMAADTLADMLGGWFGRGGPAVGAWETTVKPAGPAIAARDPAWTAAVVARAPADITTASIDRAGAHIYRPAGPRLNGATHALDGIASYYWQGQVTATGERFDKRALTAAHKTLPFGTRVRVTRVDTGSSVVVRINDRGPFKQGRVIDLSERAAEDLGITARGVMPVQLEVLGQ